MFVPDLPVYSAKFILGGEQAILTGNRKHFYTYDMGSNKLERGVCGTINEKNLSNVTVCQDNDFMCFASQNTGEAHVLSQKTKKELFQVKMNGSINCTAFGRDGLHLFTAGDQGDIYQWDIRATKKCVQRIADSGNFHTTCIDVSPNGQYIATGSKMGTVNIFDLDKGGVLADNQEPAKTIMNLTTSITDIKFNPTSELLTFCSKWKKNAIRMVHLPSYKVYQNFPGAATGILKYPFNISYSHQGEFLAAGNDEGKAHLWYIPYFN